MGEDDEDEDSASKSKLPITVKTLSKYNERITVTAKQTNKQTNKHTHTEAGKVIGRKTKEHNKR